MVPNIFRSNSCRAEFLSLESPKAPNKCPSEAEYFAKTGEDILDFALTLEYAHSSFPSENVHFFAIPAEDIHDFTVTTNDVLAQFHSVLGESMHNILAYV